MRCRINFRFYVLLLCVVYFTMLYIFHGNLQTEGKTHATNRRAIFAEFETAFLKIKSPIDIKRKVLESPQESFDVTELKHHVQHGITTEVSRNRDSSFPNSKNKSNHQNVLKTNCFIPGLTPNRTFQALESSFYVYSAYLDKRYSDKFVRIMAVLSLNKANRRLTVFCNFRSRNGSQLRSSAIFYELCENHGRMYGGFVLSCPVPNEDICHVNVTLKIEAVKRFYYVPETVPANLPVSQLSPPQLTSEVVDRHERKTNGAMKTPYNFSICVPPLFGDIDVSKFVEFVELNRMLGFQHFIFYISNIKNPDMFKVLDYYKEKGIVTLIKWTLPSAIQNGQIWYNGQLSAHNDCLYRSMSLTQYLAIIDLDEFIIPHNGETTLTNVIPKLFEDTKVCGLSFHSAFYDKKFSKNKSTSKLLTAKYTGRSVIFSKVRTKVLVKPSKIFEVGIHHISKPAAEDFKVEKVDTSLAYLHHYRDCVPNYGMKCKEFIEDNTLLNVTHQLEDSVSIVLRSVFEQRIKKQEI